MMSDSYNVPYEESWEACQRRQDAAWKQANQKHFTTANNPLVTMTPEQATAQDIVRANMRALRVDRDNRENPVSGHIYSGIMNMRYGG